MKTLPLILLSLLLSACGQSEQDSLEQSIAVDARNVVADYMEDQVEQTVRAQSQSIKASSSILTATSTALATASSTPLTAIEQAILKMETATSTPARQPPESNGLAKPGEPTTLNWDALFPPGFNPQAIMLRYGDQLDAITDNDPQAMSIFQQIQEELDNAPVNSALDGQLIRLPGFMAPLELKQGRIAEFLLVPYFGACIHSPPPPLNQTVLVKAREGEGIKSEDAYEPIWVTGQISIEGQQTNIGNAGYRIENAQIEIYTPPVQ